MAVGAPQSKLVQRTIRSAGATSDVFPAYEHLECLTEREVG
jgi:hypothetical protein